MEKSILFEIVLLLGMGLAACAGPATPSPTPAGETPAVSAVAKAEWEQKWEGVLVEAKKEGKVMVYAGWSPEARVSIAEKFRDKFGMEAEFTPFGAGAEMTARVHAEKRAGLNIADVFGHGGPTLVVTMKPLGLLGPVEPLLILPEVRDSKSWLGGELPFYDRDKTAIGMMATTQRNIVYNSTMIKEGEITSYKDLLKPQYKGKIALHDPARTGGGSAMFGMLAHVVWNREEASEWLRRLVKDQEAFISHDPRQIAEWIARGKYAIGLGVSTDEVYRFATAGAPISIAYPAEGTYSSPGGGCLGVAAVRPHTSATIVFVNWLLSKEGQTVFSRSMGIPSTRIDIPPVEEIAPRRPGEKIIFATEELTLLRDELMALAKKTIAEATK